MLTKYMSNKNKGFTLIELLVVIAIIGLLSSVVMSSVNEARVKGADAAIKSNTSSIRSQAALVYDANGNYNAVCGNNSIAQDETIAKAIASIKTANGGTDPECNPAGGSTDATAWALATPLKTVGAYWCMDSAGNASSSNSALIGSATAALADTDATVCN